MITGGGDGEGIVGATSVNAPASATCGPGANRVHPPGTGRRVRLLTDAIRLHHSQGTLHANDSARGNSHRLALSADPSRARRIGRPRALRNPVRVVRLCFHIRVVTQTRTVHDGFMLSSPLATPHNPRYKAGFIYAFVAYREAVTTQVSINPSYRFSASARARPQTENPVRALFERTREQPAGAMLFEQTTTYGVTTVSMLYFDYACRRASARSPGVAAPCPKPMPAQTPRQLAAGNSAVAPAAPPFKPVPQAASAPATAPVPPSSALAPERPCAAVSLKPVEPSKTSDPFDWDKRPVEEMRYRYDVWNALGQKKPLRLEISLKASPQESKTVTPRKIDEKGLSFSAEDADGNLEKIPFSDVSRLRVLSA